jgi:CO dehydrogenase maturation factor
MGEFHCPLGAAFYDDEDCILCEMCSAQTEQEMVEASKKIRAYLRSRAPRAVKVRKIAVAGKGGVGKSTVTVLIARALKAKGFNVVVLDTDESNPGLLKLFGFERAPEPLITLLPRFASSDNHPDTGWLKQDTINTASIPSTYVLRNDGLKFLMVGKIQDPFQGCACSMADMSRDLIGKLVLEEKEVVLVDMEAGVESFGRGVERHMDAVLVVVEPSLESIALAEKINFMAQGMGIQRVLAVLNKVASEKARERMYDELNKRNVKIAGVISFDAALSEAGLDGNVPVGSSATENIREIVDSLLDGAMSQVAG